MHNEQDSFFNQRRIAQNLRKRDFPQYTRLFTFKYFLYIWLATLPLSVSAL